MDDDKAGDGMRLVPSGARAKAPGSRFTGDVWVDWVTEGAAADSARLAEVRFSPGVRIAWHCHALGQTLHVTAGTGLVQSRGGDVTRVQLGDTVYTPPGVWHWHGAAPKSFMMQLAMSGKAGRPDQPDVEGGEHISDESYRAAHRAAAARFESAEAHRDG